LEYVTRPRLKTFDAPLIDVIDDANIPPVQDSAKEIFNFFLINFFIKFLIIKYNFLVS
jgi:hypothetical protein